MKPINSINYARSQELSIAKYAPGETQIQI